MVTLRKRMPEWKTDRAREMRRKPTRSEAALWQMLRNRRLGVKFRRQHPALGWILDFYCPEAKLAVELDGSHHDGSRDEVRDKAIMALGIRTLRIPSADVFVRPHCVIAAINAELGRA